MSKYSECCGAKYHLDEDYEPVCNDCQESCKADEMDEDNSEEMIRDAEEMRGY